MGFNILSLNYEKKIIKDEDIGKIMWFFFYIFCNAKIEQFSL